MLFWQDNNSEKISCSKFRCGVLLHVTMAIVLLFSNACMFAPGDVSYVGTETDYVDVKGVLFEPYGKVFLEIQDPITGLFETAPSGATLSYGSPLLNYYGHDIYGWEIRTRIPSRYWIDGGSGKRALYRLKTEDNMILPPSVANWRSCQSEHGFGGFAANCLDWENPIAEFRTQDYNVVEPSNWEVRVADFTVLDNDEGSDGDEPWILLITYKVTVGAANSYRAKDLSSEELAQLIDQSATASSTDADHPHGEWYQDGQWHTFAEQYQPNHLFTNIVSVDNWDEALARGVDIIGITAVGFEYDKWAEDKIRDAMDEQAAKIEQALKETLVMADLSEVNPDGDLFLELKPVFDEFKKKLTRPSGIAGGGGLEELAKFHDFVGRATAIYAAVHGDLRAKNALGLNCNEIDTNEIALGSAEENAYMIPGSFQTYYLREPDPSAIPDQMEPQYTTVCALDAENSPIMTIRDWEPELPYEGNGQQSPEQPLPAAYTDNVNQGGIGAYQIRLDLNYKGSPTQCPWEFCDRVNAASTAGF